VVDTFTVAPNDRYKDTAAFTGPRGPEFALLVDPDELQVLHPDYVTHRVTADEVGMLLRRITDPAMKICGGSLRGRTTWWTWKWTWCPGR